MADPTTLVVDDPDGVDIDPITSRWGLLDRPAVRVVQLFVGLGILALVVIPGTGFDGSTRVVLTLVGAVVAINGGGVLLRLRRPGGITLGTWLALGWIVLVVALALVAPLLPLGEAEDTAATLRDPRLLRPAPGTEHILGTNNSGLDQFARVVQGARTSLVVALSASALGLFVGGAFGVVAGFRRGRIDAVLGVFTDVILAFPALVLLLAVASVVTPSLPSITLTLAFLTLPSYIRMARANTSTVVHRDFIAAARSMGASDRRILITEVVPNVIQPLLSYALVSLSVLIVAEAALSFLGLGLAPPKATWGNMIAEGNGGMAEQAPHLVLVPGTVLFLTVLSLNLLGEAARHRWDPLRRSS